MLIVQLTGHSTTRTCELFPQTQFNCSRNLWIRKPLDLVFFFSDHMVEVDWSDDGNWTHPLMSPLHALQLHPGAKVFHYAIELFEGMKAYRGVDNRIRLFRPEKNMERMRSSAVRSALPDFDSEELLKIIAHLIQIDVDWVPYSKTASLYLRPTLIGTDPRLGVAHSTSAKLYVISSPAGCYYPTGMKPISLLADSRFTRAFPGGVGQFKMGSNYAPTMAVGKAALEMDCQQVLWLYDREELITEVGAMNIFVFWINQNGDYELITPPLRDGVILPGVTRDSLLQLGKGWNEFRVVEEYPSMYDIRRAIAENRMLQMFGAGTAAVIQPVDRILYWNQETQFYETLNIPTMTSSNVMQRLYDTIMDIQFGRVEMPEWTRIVV
ncbi:Branched-chain-amino-acid aminotransferase [Aphelenchoides besseyi]|nr:Branched-chain-amino-acid aminotransferase [Aphelenchoides besseyi]